MRSQRGGSFLEILIAMVIFVGSAMGLLTQQWQISQAVHHMQSDLNELWDKDNQEELVGSRPNIGWRKPSNLRLGQ